MFFNSLLKVKVFEKGFFSDSMLGHVQISLRELDTLATSEGFCNLNHKSHTIKLEYGLYLREPLAKGNKSITVIKLVNMYF